MPIYFKPLTILFVLAMFYIQWKKGYLNRLKSFAVRGWKLEVKWLLYALALTIPFLFIDAALLEMIQSVDIQVIARFGRAIGRGVTPWLVMSVSYLLFEILRKTKVSQFIFGCLFSSSLAAVSAYLLKLISIRNRPIDSESAFSFFNLGQSIKELDLAQSFPSGDVAVVAGACAYCFFKVLNPILKLCMLILPLTTGYSRMLLEKHWPTDVWVGCVVGYLAGHFLWRFQQLKEAGVSVESYSEQTL